jgi:hypothetical protein
MVRIPMTRRERLLKAFARFADQFAPRRPSRRIWIVDAPSIVPETN